MKRHLGQISKTWVTVKILQHITKIEFSLPNHAEGILAAAEWKDSHENFLFVFQALAKNLEQPEIKDWLGNTKDMLMAEKSGKDKDAEAAKLNAILAK